MLCFVFVVVSYTTLTQRAAPSYRLADDDCDDGDHVRDVDDSVAVDVSSTKGALREGGQTQNGVGQGDQIQNADLAVAVDISRDERAACRRWRE